MSRLHLLDANVFRAVVDEASPRHSEVVAAIERLGELVCLSTVTVGEVEYGLARTHDLEQEIVQRIRRTLRSLPILEIDRHAAEPYGRLRAWLHEHFAPKNRRKKLKSLSQLVDPTTDRELGIQENDLWLVSQAIAIDAVLVTADRMQRIMEAVEATGQELHRASW